MSRVNVEGPRNTSQNRGRTPLSPLLFLDVDGVLNALSTYDDPASWPDWRRADVRNRLGAFPILWSPSVTERLTSWDTQELAEIHWLTTWLDDANRNLGQALGLPRWQVLGGHLAADPALSSSGGAYGWWKADLVDEYLAQHPGRAFVWLDDDLRVMTKLQARLRAQHDCLLIGPDSSIGLTPQHLDQVESWLRGRTGSAVNGAAS